MTFCLKSGAIVTITHQETIPQSNYKVTIYQTIHLEHQYFIYNHKGKIAI